MAKRSSAEQRIKEIKKYGLMGVGRREALKHLDDQRLTYRGAIVAKCYECMVYYADGKVDCNIPTCPLYQYMPYKGKTLKRRERDGKDELPEEDL
jgi:hypothetical protein